MKLRHSVPLALTLTLATIGFSQNLIGAKTPSDQQLNKQQVSGDEAEAWKQVNSLAEQGNLDKAIATLEGLIQEGTRTAAVYQKLGDLYLEAGKNPSQSETAYNQAIQLAKTAGNVQAQAEAQIALAKVKLMLGKTAEASSLLNEAKAVYQALGEPQKVSEIQQQITALSDDTNKGRSLPRPVFRGDDSGGN